MILPLPLDFIHCDPMPVPPAVARESMTWWRWYSRVTLQARSEAA